jgi:hypothetical protein
MKHNFKGWQWLKSSDDNEYSFVRIIGTFNIMFIQPIVLWFVYTNKDFREITNMWQFFVIGLPSLTSILLFVLQVLKENKSISIKFGNKEYGVGSKQGGLNK